MGIRSQNNPIAAYLDVFSRSGTDAATAAVGPTSGLTASGGVISDYTSGSDVYRAHIFTSSGTFQVTEVGDFGSNIDYLVVGGGGGAAAVHGGNGTGGAGGGGLRTNMPACPYAQAAYPVSTTNPYTVIVGGGGGGVLEVPSVQPVASQGSQSEIYPTPGGSGSGIYASGGGAGQTREWAPGPVQTGGSGGGGDTYSPGTYTGGTVASPDGRSPTVQGFAGSAKGPNSGGGGGGAGEAGSTDGQGQGGDGLQILIAESPTVPAPTRTVGADGGYFAGGGGGEYSPGTGTPGYPGGLGGGGSAAARTVDGIRGKFATGGGGGAGKSNPPTHPTSLLGNGGSGIVVVRYKIGSVLNHKATGGVISFYNDKTIHTFTSSGTFVCPGSFSETCEYVVIGGGGSGGSGSANTNNGGSGGGAGTYRTASVSVTSGTYNITIGAGGNKNNGTNNGSQGGTTTLALPSSVASPGGGYGYPGPTPGYNGGSSGGTVTQSTTASGDPFPGTIGATPTSGWGHIGNNPPSVPAYNTGGGGGAGGAAPPQPGANLSPGGVGIQIPSTFRNPKSGVGAPGPTSPGVTGADTSGKFYVAGGGGGAAGHPQPAQPKGGDGGAGGGGDGGGIDPNGNSYTGNGSDALQNTGSGGGGGPTGDKTFAGGGGSGIVLIAYPT